MGTVTVLGMCTSIVLVLLLSNGAHALQRLHSLDDASVLDLFGRGSPPSRTPTSNPTISIRPCDRFLNRRCSNVRGLGIECNSCTAEIATVAFANHSCTVAMRKKFCALRKPDAVTYHDCSGLLKTKCSAYLTQGHEACIRCLYRVKKKMLTRFMCTASTFREVCPQDKRDTTKIENLDKVFSNKPKFNFAPTPFTIAVGVKQTPFPCDNDDIQMYCQENLPSSLLFLHHSFFGFKQFKRSTKLCFPLLDRHARACKLSREAVYELPVDSYNRDKSEMKAQCWQCVQGSCNGCVKPTQAPTTVPTASTPIPTPSPTTTPTRAPTFAHCFNETARYCSAKGLQCQVCITTVAQPSLVALHKMCTPYMAALKVKACCTETDLSKFCDILPAVRNAPSEQKDVLEKAEQITHELAIEEKTLLAENASFRYYTLSDKNNSQEAQTFNRLMHHQIRAVQHSLQKSRAAHNRCIVFLGSKCGWAQNNGDACMKCLGKLHGPEMKRAYCTIYNLDHYCFMPMVRARVLPTRRSAFPPHPSLRPTPAVARAKAALFHEDAGENIPLKLVSNFTKSRGPSSRPQHPTLLTIRDNSKLGTDGFLARVHNLAGPLARYNNAVSKPVKNDAISKTGEPMFDLVMKDGTQLSLSSNKLLTIADPAYSVTNKGKPKQTPATTKKAKEGFSEDAGENVQQLSNVASPEKFFAESPLVYTHMKDPLSQKTRSMSSSSEGLVLSRVASLEAFYKKHDPSKIKNILNLLQGVSFKTLKMVLFQKYGELPQGWSDKVTSKIQSAAKVQGVNVPGDLISKNASADATSTATTPRTNANATANTTAPASAAHKTWQSWTPQQVASWLRLQSALVNCNYRLPSGCTTSVAFANAAHTFLDAGIGGQQLSSVTEGMLSSIGVQGSTFQHHLLSAIRRLMLHHHPSWTKSQR